jgi:serine/threonine protein kinase
VKEMSHDHPSPQESAEATEHFQQEVFLLARLKHPNLPSIYDYFPEGGRWYVVMDFIEGETLEDYLTRAGNGHQAGGPLNVEEALRIGIALCTVLDYLHNRQPPIIFRDLKPANIMRTSAGQLYLIDFGIARIFKQDKAKDTTALGSPGYAAPEQYGKAQTTPRSDIYALGALLHQLVTGNDPSETPFVFQPPRLSGYSKLSSLIMQMLEVDATKRPADVATVKEKLEWLARGHAPGLAAQVHPTQGHLPGNQAPSHSQGLAAPVNLPVQYGGGQAQQQMYQPSQPASTPAPTKRGISRRVAVVGIIGAIVSGQVILSLFNRQSQTVPSSPPIQVTSVPQTPATASIGPNLQSYLLPPRAIWSVAWSPSGKYVASGIGTGIIFINDAATQATVQTYNGHKTAVATIAWSPDGRLIASASYDQTVQVWEANTGKLIATYTDPFGAVMGVAWSPDGKHLVSGGYEGSIQVWDARSGKILNSSASQGGEIASVAWSPNGRYIAYGGTTNLVQVVQVKSLDTLLYVFQGHGDVVQSVAWSPDSRRIASASRDHTVQVWDALTGNDIFAYHGHSDQVWSAVWSPNGRRIVSGSFDNTVQVWNTADGSNASTFQDGNQVVTVTLSPEGKSAASGDVNGTLKWWNVGA